MSTRRVYQAQKDQLKESAARDNPSTARIVSQMSCAKTAAEFAQHRTGISESLGELAIVVRDKLFRVNEDLGRQRKRLPESNASWWVGSLCPAVPRTVVRTFGTTERMRTLGVRRSSYRANRRALVGKRSTKSCVASDRSLTSDADGQLRHYSDG